MSEKMIITSDEIKALMSFVSRDCDWRMRLQDLGAGLLIVMPQANSFADQLKNIVMRNDCPIEQVSIEDVKNVELHSPEAKLLTVGQSCIVLMSVNEEMNNAIINTIFPIELDYMRH